MTPAIQQLDLVEYIASLGERTGSQEDRAWPRLREELAPTVPDEVLALLPRRAAAWRRIIAPIPASAVTVMVSVLWTHQVDEWVRQPDQSLLLGRDGRIDAIPGRWPATTRTIALTAEAALDLPWPLEPLDFSDTCAEFRFAPDRATDALTARGLLFGLIEKMKGVQV